MILFGTKYRLLVFCFSTVLAVMLFQTPVQNMGTIFALATMGVTSICVLLSKQDNFRMGASFWYLVLFIFIFLLNSLTSTFCSSKDVYKFSAQSFFTLLLYRISLSKAEQRYLIYAYEICLTVWSIFIIQSCLDAGPKRYIHSDIELFGAVMDPNYIGIPLVSSSLFLMNDILSFTNKKLLLFQLIAYFITVVAIVDTSSRSNFLVYELGNGLLFFMFLRNSKIGIKKYIALIVVFAGIAYAFSKLFVIYADNFDRMTEINSDSGLRLVVWKNSVDLWLTDVDTILLGNGYGAVAAIGRLCSHNTYLQVLSEFGLIGFFFFMAYLLKTFLDCRKADNIMSLVLFATLIHIFFLNTLDNRCVWGLLAWTAMINDFKLEEKHINN